MKAITVKSFFKKVSADQAKRSPALGDKIGVKRPDLNWTFEAVEATDLEALNKNQVVYFLNAALENYGKALIADNSENWNYVPAGITLQAAYDYATAETSRARVLTKVTALAFAKFYAAHAPALLSIPQAAANAAETVLTEWLTYAKKDNFRAAMHARLIQFAEAVMSQPEDSEVMAEFVESEADLPAVLDSLVKAFSEAETVAITADAL